MFVYLKLLMITTLIFKDILNTLKKKFSVFDLKKYYNYKLYNAS
jgi:hypothetical protein